MSKYAKVIVVVAVAGYSALSIVSLALCDRPLTYCAQLLLPTLPLYRKWCIVPS